MDEVQLQEVELKPVWMKVRFAFPFHWQIYSKHWFEYKWTRIDWSLKKQRVQPLNGLFAVAFQFVIWFSGKNHGLVNE